MKLLIVLSSRDFDNFTRRATVEAICNLNKDTTLVFFTGIKGFPVKRPSNKSLKYKAFYSFSLGKLKKLRWLELVIKYSYWRLFISKFDTVFLTDPNQDIFLSFISITKKLLYLIRDPSVFLSKKNYDTERKILLRNPHVFAISKGLCNHYIEKYYPDIKLNKVTYWPNTVDLKVWDYSKFSPNLSKIHPVIGISGNLTDWLDYELLDYIVRSNSDYKFEVYGNNELNGQALLNFQCALKHVNITYNGYVPFKKIPEIVSQWNVGLVLGRKDAEFSIYWGNNKIYQFTALGKPFVSYRHNDEYDKFGDAAFLANSKEEYSKMIRKAVEKSYDKGFQMYCVQKAKENSNIIRAKQLLEAILN